MPDPPPPNPPEPPEPPPFEPPIVTAGDPQADRVNVRDFGATGDGVTDDTAALLRARDAVLAQRGGVFYAPKGRYIHTQLLDLGDDSAFSSVQPQGDGAFNTVFLWKGDPNGTALRFNRAKLVDCGGFAVINPRGNVGTNAAAVAARGSSTGVWLTGPAGGTQTNSGILRNLVIQGFDKGLRIGDASLPGLPCASEMQFLNPVLTFNNYGVYAENANSTDLDFYLLEASQNQYGLYSVNSEPIHVWGGAMSSNTVEDIHLTSGGVFVIDGVRAENSVRFFTNAGNSAPKGVRISNCVVEGTPPPDGILIQLGAGLVTVEDCLLCTGGISANGQSVASALTLLNSLIGDTVPFRLGASGGTLHGNLRYTVMGCYQGDGLQNVAVRAFADRSGKIEMGSNAFNDAWRKEVDGTLSTDRAFGIGGGSLHGRAGGLYWTDPAGVEHALVTP